VTASARTRGQEHPGNAQTHTHIHTHALTAPLCFVIVLCCCMSERFME
jgi:hypothetical protein